MLITRKNIASAHISRVDTANRKLQATSFVAIATTTLNDNAIHEASQPAPIASVGQALYPSMGSCMAHVPIPNANTCARMPAHASM
jgi:hypothetical protein